MVTDVLSSFCFTTSPEAETNLLREGVKPDRIFFVGNIMIDSLLFYLEKAERSRILDELGARPRRIRARHAPPAVQRRRERGIRGNHGGARRVSRARSPSIFPVHPRTRKMIESARGAIEIPEGLKLIEPLGYLDFVKAMRHARIVVTDSGGIQEETTVLGIPCITVRENTERPITVEIGTNVLVGTGSRENTGARRRGFSPVPRAPHRVPPLWDGKTAERIADILEQTVPGLNMESHTSSKSSFAAGYLWTFGATALPLLSAFLISLITARWLGPGGVGLINWTMALATVLLIAGKFGVDGAASKLLSEYQATAPWRMRRLIRLSVLMRLMFTVPTALAAFVFAPWFTTFFKEPALLPLFRMSGLLILAVSLNELFDLMTLGISRFRFLFFVRCSMLAAKVSLVLAAVLLGFGVEGVFGGFIAGIFIPCALSAFMLFTLSGAPAPAGDAERIWSRLFRLSVPLAISGASVAIFTVEDKLMLGYFQSKVDVGFYSVARSFTETALFPTFALIMMLRPGLASAYAAGDRERCAALTNRSIRGSFVYAALVAVVFVVPRPGDRRRALRGEVRAFRASPHALYPAHRDAVHRCRRSSRAHRGESRRHLRPAHLRRRGGEFHPQHRAHSEARLDRRDHRDARFLYSDRDYRAQDALGRLPAILAPGRHRRRRENGAHRRAHRACIPCLRRRAARISS